VALCVGITKHRRGPKGTIAYGSQTVLRLAEAERERTAERARKSGEP